MDTFSHILIAFLLLGKVDLRLAAFAGIVALILDLDIVLTPFSRKFPILEHRGFVHSVFVVAAVALVASFIYSELTAYTFLQSMIAGLTGGFTHLMGDTLGNYGTATLWPFIKKHVKMDITMGVDPLTIVVSVVSLPLLWSSFRHANVQLFNSVYFIAALFFSLYFIIRISLKIGAYSRFKTKTLPMFNPLKYKLLYITEYQEGNQKYRELKWTTGNLITGKTSAESRFILPLMDVVPPLDTDEKLIAYSNKLEDVQHALEFSEYHICEILKRFENKAVLFWYSLELSSVRFRMGVTVILDRDGTHQIKRYYPYKKLEDEL